MDFAKRLCKMLRPKDRSRSTQRNDVRSNGREGVRVPSDEAPSNATKQKVEAAKQYIEKHYKEQMKNLNERRERYELYASVSLYDRSE